MQAGCRAHSDQDGFSFDLHQPRVELSRVEQEAEEGRKNLLRHTRRIEMGKVEDSLAPIRAARNFFFTRKSINVMRLVRQDFFVNKSYQISLNLLAHTALLFGTLSRLRSPRISSFVISRVQQPESGTYESQRVKALAPTSSSHRTNQWHLRYRITFGR